jgi:hypothetical protein
MTRAWLDTRLRGAKKGRTWSGCGRGGLPDLGTMAQSLRFQRPHHHDNSLAPLLIDAVRAFTDAVTYSNDISRWSVERSHGGKKGRPVT